MAQFTAAHDQNDADRAFLLDHSIAILGAPIPLGQPMENWLAYLAFHGAGETIRNMWSLKK